MRVLKYSMSKVTRCLSMSIAEHTQLMFVW